MKIAVTYENGQIFQHFGHTEQFKIYTVEDGKVVSAAVVDTNGRVLYELIFFYDVFLLAMGYKNLYIFYQLGLFLLILTLLFLYQI